MEVFMQLQKLFSVVKQQSFYFLDHDKYVYANTKSQAVAEKTAKIVLEGQHFAVQDICTHVAHRHVEYYTVSSLLRFTLLWISALILNVFEWP